MLLKLSRTGICTLFCALLLSALPAQAQSTQAKTGNDWEGKNYSVKGDWKIEDQKLVLMKNFKTNRGPDVKVFLSQKEMYKINNRTDITQFSDYVAPLRHASGKQSFSLEGFDLSKYKSVVLYCEKYNVVWGGFNL